MRGIFFRILVIIPLNFIPSELLTLFLFRVFRVFRGFTKLRGDLFETV
jgi:hypothetical protein